MVFWYPRPSPHLTRQNDGILVHWDLLLLRCPLGQPGLVLPQHLLENVNPSMGIMRRRSTLDFGGKVLPHLRDERPRGPVPRLGVVEGFGKLFGFEQLDA